MFDNYTDSMKEIIYNAQNMAVENHNTVIEPVHILSSMADSQSESAKALFDELKLNSNVFLADIKNILNALPKTAEITNQIYFSQDCLKMFEKAGEKAKQLKDKFVSPEHILLAMCSVEGDLKRIEDKYSII